MNGCRPLTDEEVSLVLKNLKTPRDRCLFVLGIRTGFRISELLSLRARDCLQYGDIVKALTVERKNMKGKRRSRQVPLHPEARSALRAYLLSSNDAEKPEVSGTARLFPFTRQHAWRIFKRAVTAAALTGKLGTHAMRKTFAKRVYHALGKDLINTQKAMGHASVASTASYLAFEQDEIDKAILGDQ